MASADELRKQLRAQHLLVEQMKEQVEVAQGPMPTIYKAVAAVAVVLLIGGAFHQAAAATGTRASVGHGGMAAKLPYDAYKVPVVQRRWTTERMLQHFNVDNPSRVTWALGVNSLLALESALADPKVHIIEAHVAYSEKVTARGVVMQPIMSNSTFIPSALTFDVFMEAFVRSATYKGLSLVFHDPRIVESCLRLIDIEDDYGRFHGPMILGAEILPGPIGSLPDIGRIPADPGAQLAEALAGSNPVMAAQLTFLKFDGLAMLDKIQQYVPTSILQVGWGSQGTCADAELAPGGWRRHSARRLLGNLGQQLSQTPGARAVASAVTARPTPVATEPPFDGVWGNGYNMYEKARTYKGQRIISPEMVADLLDTLKQSAFDGDVIVDVPLCLFHNSAPAQQVYKEKFGYTVAVSGHFNPVRHQGLKWLHDMGDKSETFVKLAETQEEPDPASAARSELVWDTPPPPPAPLTVMAGGGGLRPGDVSARP